jgi:hypothetical protein
MKARNANEQSLPPFENEAWDKMELLLDQHLPQKKDKRRFFFWWFAVLIPIGFAGYYLMYHSSNQPVKGSENSVLTNEKNTNPSSTKSTTTINQIINGAHQDKVSFSTSSSQKLKVALEAKAADNLLQKSKIHKNFLLKNEYEISYKKNKTTKQVGVNAKPLLQKSLLNTVANFPSHTTYKASKNEINGKPENNNEIAKSEGKAPPSNKSLSPAQDTITSKEIKAVDEKSSAVGFKKPDVRKKESNNHFYLTLTSGVEANGTSLSNLGAATPVYGAGVQYARGKLFIRTGVMVTKKLYAAKDKDYNRKTGTWMSIVTFDNIEANCKIIEIPVSVGYTVTSKKKTSAHIIAGTSAYFMKKEDYQFYFKNQSGNDTTRNAAFTNNSNHYFSSLNLSAGIEQKISNRFSITAEPTIKIPLGGIGFGKVKVYSAGLIIAAKIKLK